jgi:hypothetical protein
VTGSLRCTGCGADLPISASYCARCGRSAAPELRDLERIGGPAEPFPAGRERVVSESGGPPRRRGLAGLVAVVAVLVATVVLLSGGGDGGGGAGDDGGDAASAPATTRPGTPNTRLNYPDPTAPGETTSSRPTTTSPPSTTTSTTTTTTIVTFVGDGPAPLLGAETGGLSLYALGDGSLRRVELDTGRVTALEVPSNVQQSYALRVRGDRLEVRNGSLRSYVALDLAGGVQTGDLVSGGGDEIDVEGTDLTWVVYSDVGNGGIVLRRGGEEIVRHEFGGGVYVSGVVGDRALLSGGGRIFTLDPAGRVRPYAVGQVVAAGGRWVVWTACDDDLRCSYHVGDAERPDARRVVTPPELTATMYSYGYGYASASLVSPDGRVALLGAQDGLRLVELETGRMIDTDSSAGQWGPWAWSPDSAWLFRYDASGRVEAVSTGDGHAVTLLPSIRAQQTGPRLLAVG